MNWLGLFQAWSVAVLIVSAIVLAAIFIPSIVFITISVLVLVVVMTYLIYEERFS